MTARHKLHLMPGTKVHTAASEIDAGELTRWLAKSAVIQWDYKNIVKRKGVLERLK